METRLQTEAEIKARYSIVLRSTWESKYFSADSVQEDVNVAKLEAVASNCRVDLWNYSVSHVAEIDANGDVVGSVKTYE